MTNNTTANVAPVKKVYFNLRFAVKRGPEAWVKSVRFADGPGMKVKSVSFTAKREEAAPFSRAHAHAVAEGYWKNVIAVYTTDGAVHEDATLELAKAHADRRRRNAEVRAEFEASMRELFAGALEAIPGLRKALEDGTF